MVINKNLPPQQFKTKTLSQNMKVTQTDVTSQVQDEKNLNEAVKISLSSNEPIIKARNGYVNVEQEKRIQMLKDHYAKMNEDNKKFDNIRQHIADKYYNIHSPYYIQGLTIEERDLAATNEHFYSKYGILPSYNFTDAIFKDMGPLLGGQLDDVRERLFNREAVNKQFQTLLNMYNITIPKDEKLIFIIEPNYYTVKVNGAKDENLAFAIEEILNKNSENVRELFLHISFVKSDNNTQFTQEKKNKSSLVNTVKEVTGYHLAELEVKGDSFVTSDGVDIFELFSKNFEHRLPEMERNSVLIFFENRIRELARKGFENVPDLVLSIEYENGSFYDIGQKENYGRGKTAWIEEWNIAKTNEYNSLKGNNYVSKYRENPSLFTQSINKYDLEKEFLEVTGFNINDLQEKDGKYLTESGEDIFELYKKKITTKYLFSKDLQEAKLHFYESLLKDFSKIGLGNIPNFEPKKDDDLMDILNKIEPLEIYV